MSTETPAAPPFRLIVDHQISRDTVRCLEQLLEQAKSGRLIGLAFCAMYQQRKYIVDTTGEAKRNPTWAAGMLRALDYKLSAKIARGR